MSCLANSSARGNVGGRRGKLYIAYLSMIHCKSDFLSMHRLVQDLELLVVGLITCG